MQPRTQFSSGIWKVSDRKSRGLWWPRANPSCYFERHGGTAAGPSSHAELSLQTRATISSALAALADVRVAISSGLAAFAQARAAFERSGVTRTHPTSHSERSNSIGQARATISRAQQLQCRQATLICLSVQGLQSLLRKSRRLFALLTGLKAPGNYSGKFGSPQKIRFYDWRDTNLQVLWFLDLWPTESPLSIYLNIPKYV